MPNKSAQEKHVRQAEKRREANRAKRSTMRTAVRRVREAVAEQNVESLEARIRDAQSKLAKAAKTNLIKKGNASRRISRLMAQAAKVKAAKA